MVNIGTQFFLSFVKNITGTESQQNWTCLEAGELGVQPFVDSKKNSFLQQKLGKISTSNPKYYYSIFLPTYDKNFL